MFAMTKNPPMLKPLFLFLSTVAFSSVIAQPTLTANANIGTAGNDVFMYEGTATTPGVPGPNATWNFSTIGQANNSTTHWKSCAQVGDCSTYPGTTVVAQRTIGTTYYIGNTNLSVKGEIVSGIPIVYSNPKDVLHFPFAYGTSFTDAYQATFTTSGNPVYRNGSNYVEADGYGTLMIPSGSFTNVLRLHSTDTYQDSAIISGIAFTTNYVVESYYWYSPAFRDYLMLYTTTTVNGNPTVDKVYYTLQQATGVQTINELVSNIQVFPNPATDHVSVKFTPKQQTKMSFILRDVVGKNVFSIDEKLYDHSEQIIDIPTAQLAKGVYMLLIQSQNGATENRKIQVL